MISIIMPLYNGVEFLDDSIPSIINQTYNKWELIIGINGHKKNAITKIANKIKSFNDHRIKAIVSNQRGKCRTLNKLAYHAKYKYICLMDVDDKWMPNKLEQQIPFINTYDVVGSDAEYFGDKDGYPGLFLGKLSPPMFSWQNPVINSAVMMRKVDAYWDVEWEGLDDYNMWIELLKNKKTFYNVPQILIQHRIHSASFFNNKNDKLNQKLKDEKLHKLTDEEIAVLSDIYEHKKWEL